MVDTLKALEPRLERKGVTLVHGSPVDPVSNYLLNINEAEESFKHFRGSSCLFGHTHVQGGVLKSGDGIRWFKPALGEVIDYSKKRILINPGSVGQPRDRDPRAAWALFDRRKKEVQFFRSQYNIQDTQEKMQNLGSSDFLIQRIQRGT